MEWYFIFDSNDGGFAVIDTDKERALALAQDISEFDGSCELVDEFPADNIGDNRIDTMGLDVY